MKKNKVRMNTKILKNRMTSLFDFDTIISNTHFAEDIFDLRY